MVLPPIKGSYKKRPPLPPNPVKIAVDAKKEAVKTADKFDALKEEVIAKIDDVEAKVIDTTETLEKRTIEAINSVETLSNKVEEAISNIKNGEPGKDGETPEVDYDSIISEVLEKIPEPEKPDIEKIVKEVLSKIPKPKDIDIKKLRNEIIKSLPQKKGDLKIITEKVEIDPMSVIEKIMELPADKFKLKLDQIDGLDQTINAFRSQLSRGYLHGGGDTLVAGSGITLTTNANGTKTISFSGTSEDHKVSITSADTTADYLNSKISVSGGIVKSITSPGGNEVLNLDGSVFYLASNPAGYLTATTGDQLYLKLDQTTPQTTVGTFTFPNVKVSSLTPTQIIVAGTDGLLTDCDCLTYTEDSSNAILQLLATNPTVHTSVNVFSSWGSATYGDDRIILGSNIGIGNSSHTGYLGYFNGLMGVNSLEIFSLNAGGLLKSSAPNGAVSIASVGIDYDNYWTKTGTILSPRTSGDSISSIINNILSTPTDGITILNTTAATNANRVQMSPRLRLGGSAYQFAVGVGSKTHDYTLDVLPVTGPTATTSSLRIGVSVNGAAYTYPFVLSNVGVLSGLSSITGLSSLTVSGIISGGLGSKFGDANSFYTFNTYNLGGTAFPAIIPTSVGGGAGVFKGSFNVVPNAGDGATNIGIYDESTGGWFLLNDYNNIYSHGADTLIITDFGTSGGNVWTDANWTFVNNIHILSDSLKHYFGAGDDMTIWYDGTYGQIKTSDVAASDLKVTCGANKTLELQNTVYTDMQFPLASGKVPASNFPTWETFTTNTEAYSFAVNDYIQLQADEAPHTWKIGTTGHLHLHCTTKAANSTGSNRYAKFEIYVAYADVNEDWVEASAFTGEVTIPTGTNALHHFYVDMGDLTLTNNLIGTQFKCRVKRIAATGGTEYSGNIFITQVGMHMEEDTLGSRQETIK